MRTQECGVIQQNNSKLTLQVMNDLTVQLYTNPKFDFLMDNKTVARGYGVADSTIKSNKSNHSDELIEGKHFVSAVTICHSAIFRLRSLALRLQ